MQTLHFEMQMVCFQSYAKRIAGCMPGVGWGVQGKYAYIFLEAGFGWFFLVLARRGWRDGRDKKDSRVVGHGTVDAHIRSFLGLDMA
jgi:hypothetical protein